MSTRRQILAFIPARSGSESVPGKNIQPYKGKPLLAHAILQAKQSPSITRIIVSTDSAEYARIARAYGAETPFLRPSEISRGDSADYEAFEHALRWLQEHEGYAPELIVHLRPTFPNRSVEDIEACISMMVQNPHYDSLRTIVPFEHPVFKMWFKDEKNLLAPCAKSDIPEAHSLPRQVLPKAYLQNAAIDIIRLGTITELHSMVGNTIYGYEMKMNDDIDTNGDLFASKMKARIPMRLSFDFDGVLANIVPDNNYAKATPIGENIDAVNRLYDAGHTILIHTARGSTTGKDWKVLTERQIRDWGIRCHELVDEQKPAADFYIDDRNLSMEEIKKHTLYD